MGGRYPFGHSFNFWGSDPAFTAHAINNWEGRLTFLGDEVGDNVLTGRSLMSHGPEQDPVRMAYMFYTYHQPHSSWDPLAVLYAVQGLGDLFEFGNVYGCNRIEANGTNRWIENQDVSDQFYLKLKVSNETAAARLDELLLDGARKVGSPVHGGFQSSGRERAWLDLRSFSLLVTC